MAPRKKHQSEVPPCSEFRIVVRPSGRRFRKWEAVVQKSEKVLSFGGRFNAKGSWHQAPPSYTWRPGNPVFAFTEDGAFDKAAALIANERKARQKQAAALLAAERKARRTEALTRIVSV